jgi:hypothetical protein
MHKSAAWTKEGSAEEPLLERFLHFLAHSCIKNAAGPGRFRKPLVYPSELQAHAFGMNYLEEARKKQN